MYSYEDRIRAIELFIKLDKRVRATIRQLGYPTKNALKGWHLPGTACTDPPMQRHVTVSPLSEGTRNTPSPSLLPLTTMLPPPRIMNPVTLELWNAPAPTASPTNSDWPSAGTGTSAGMRVS
jgi:hypothetical protein